MFPTLNNALKTSNPNKLFFNACRSEVLVQSDANNFITLDLK